MVDRGIKKMSGIKAFLEKVAAREEFDKKIENVKARFESLEKGTIQLKKNVALTILSIERRVGRGARTREK